MNWPWGKELLERWKRKHALPIVLYGALLLLAVLLYGIGDGWFQGASRDGPASSGAESLETRLEGILTEMRGAGRVRVLITYETAGERVAATVSTVDESVSEKLAKDGYDPKFGARPLRREIQRRMEDALSEELISGRLKLGDQVSATVEQGELVFQKA